MKSGLCVDLLQIYFWQRLMIEHVIFQSGCQRGVDVLFQIDGNMLIFANFGLIHLLEYTKAL